MKKTIIMIGLLAFLNGCIIKETTIREVAKTPIKTEVVNTHVTVKVEEKTVQNRESCDLMYATYKQCYGLGIRLNSTHMCIESGGELAKSISSKWGSYDLGTALGSICAVACASAHRNMSMPSYTDFSKKACQ